MPVHAHEEYVIGVDADGVLQQQDHLVFMHQVTHYIANELVLQVRSVSIHYLGICLF
jgi:hypothetical protein